jgi:hypothetical protein
MQSDVCEKYKELFSLEKMKNDLLYYKLCNVNDVVSNFDENTDVTTIINLIKNVLNTFHIHIVDTQLEDEEWIFHDNTSKQYELYENEFVFENTMKMIHTFDVATSKYLLNMHNYLQKHVENTQWTIKTKNLCASDSVCFIVFILYKK